MSCLLSRLSIILDDLSQKLGRVCLDLNLMSRNQEPMALQLLMVAVWVGVIHQLSRGWLLHVLIKEGVFPAWYGLEVLVESSRLFSVRAGVGLRRDPFRCSKLVEGDGRPIL